MGLYFFLLTILTAMLARFEENGIVKMTTSEGRRKLH